MRGALQSLLLTAVKVSRLWHIETDLKQSLGDLQSGGNGAERSGQVGQSHKADCQRGESLARRENSGILLSLLKYSAEYS